MMPAFRPGLPVGPVFRLGQHDFGQTIGLPVRDHGGLAITAQDVQGTNGAMANLPREKLNRLIENLPIFRRYWFQVCGWQIRDA